MFNEKEFEEKIQQQDIKVKRCEQHCLESFELLGKQYFELKEKPGVAELEPALELAAQKKEELEIQIEILENLKKEYIEEKRNRCMNCGIRIVVEGAKFCYNCGNQIK